MLEDEIIKKLCENVQLPEKYDECIAAKKEAINNAISRNRSSDDVKAASGEIYTSLKRILNLTRCGNDPDAFMRDIMTPLITSDTEVYKQLEQDIFGGKTNG